MEINEKEAKVVFPAIIFIIVSVLFFSVLAGFVFSSSTGVLVYEEAYAKQIALLIDKSSPNMEFFLDFSKAVELAKENEVDIEKQNLVFLRDNSVVVKLSNSGGYSFEYFSDYKINFDLNENILIIQIKE